MVIGSVDSRGSIGATEKGASAKGEKQCWYFSKKQQLRYGETRLYTNVSTWDHWYRLEHDTRQGTKKGAAVLPGHIVDVVQVRSQSIMCSVTSIRFTRLLGTKLIESSHRPDIHEQWAMVNRRWKKYKLLQFEWSSPQMSYKVLSSIRVSAK